MSGDTPAELLRAALARDATRPFLTHYDDTAGSRVELSYATFDNWVAKTANLLVDELGVDPGDRVVLALPAHWQTAAWLLACWSAGLVAEPLADGVHRIPAAAVVATDTDRLPAALDADVEEVVALSLHPLGAPLADCPPAALDYATQVRGHGDQFATSLRIGSGEAALAVADREFTGGELVAAAHETVSRFGLTSGDRIYTEVGYADLDGISTGILAPMTAGASVITSTNTGISKLNQRFTSEGITATTGRLPGYTPARLLR